MTAAESVSAENPTLASAPTVATGTATRATADSTPAREKWDLDRAPFHPSQIERWVGTREHPNPGISRVRFYDGKDPQVFSTGAVAENPQQAPITLNLMNPAGIAKVQEERVQLSAGANTNWSVSPNHPPSAAASAQTIPSPSSASSSTATAEPKSDASASLPSSSSYASSAYAAPQTPMPQPQTPAAPKRLNGHAFEVVVFRPGFTEDRKTRLPVPSNLSFAIQGPDAGFKYVEKEKLLSEEGGIKSRLISLGHGGELVLRVKNDGWVQDEAGPDFTIYENVFKVSKDVYHQEFARVAVAEIDQEGAYRWFSCDPANSRFVGCAGVLPTSKGGDAFDLSWIGASRIKYIKIVDLGNNAHTQKDNGFGFDFTEGFDFDSMVLHHAYAPSP